MITEAIKKLFEAQDIVAFGTSAEGEPNVIAVYWKHIADESTIWLIDNYMNKTLSNLEKNPRVCVSLWDPESNEGYELKGTATYSSEGETFDKAKAWIQSINPKKNPKGVVEVKVSEIFTIEPGPAAGTRLAETKQAETKQEQ